MSTLANLPSGNKRNIPTDGKDNTTFKNGDHYEGDTYKGKKQGIGKYSYSHGLHHFCFIKVFI
jgi:hypothetical protein